MRSILVTAGVMAALSLVACGPSPDPSLSAAPITSASTTPAQSASASPADVARIDDAAYLAGDPFVLPIGESGADWTAPSTAPVMANGQRAVRVGFLPASCAAVDFKITADPAPDDVWETNLHDDSDQHPYEFQAWPGAQMPSCANGQASTYLQVAYRPFVPLQAIHLVGSLDDATDASTAVDVVAVFTSADASQPSITADGFVTVGPVSGRQKPRSTKAKELFATDFTVSPLPDGSAPTQWGFMVTGCGSVGPKPIVITARVGDGEPLAVGDCSEGSFTSQMSSIPLPADGTHFAVLIAGGTTKSLLRVSEFQWRGDRP